VLGIAELNADAATRTLGAVLKHHDDEAAARDAGLAALVVGTVAVDD
jgi:hypothetical protein